ncbi:hypothetical protein BGW38_008145 [Lunasporangiospora selenospora]|uniref:Uncharacterized protein n=1 Tax=Lunasporangiospora selenospora TaxID=979761 RepID=A0A9P6K9B4_9FUNG|nr:hypothetical protein BGW38_008145 [Lunasporangiospora selenospora]
MIKSFKAFQSPYTTPDHNSMQFRSIPMVPLLMIFQSDKTVRQVIDCVPKPARAVL